MCLFMCGWCSELVFWFDIRCYIVYCILYYTLLLFPIFLPFSSSFPFSSIPLLLSSQSITFLFPILYYTLPLLYLLPFSSSPLSSIPNPSPLPHLISFYTCRYLHILIYILSLKDNLTPHVLSEWMVEV